jgi:hypothetical protein
MQTVNSEVALYHNDILPVFIFDHHIEQLQPTLPQENILDKLGATFVVVTIHPCESTRRLDVNLLRDMSKSTTWNHQHPLTILKQRLNARNSISKESGLHDQLGLFKALEGSWNKP